MLLSTLQYSYLVTSPSLEIAVSRRPSLLAFNLDLSLPSIHTSARALEFFIGYLKLCFKNYTVVLQACFAS